MMTTTRHMHAIVDTFLDRPITLHDTAVEADLSLPRAIGSARPLSGMCVKPVVVTIELAPIPPATHQPNQAQLFANRGANG